MRRSIPVLLTCCALAGGLAACGDDDESDGAAAPAPAPTAESPAPEAAPDAPAEAGAAPSGDVVEIAMNDELDFDPLSAEVAVGQTVRWTNVGDIPHNAIAEEGADFQSETFGRDGTFEFVPEEAGTIEYVCTLHPGMDGTLNVTE